jgi:hypothetical protein
MVNKAKLLEGLLPEEKDEVLKQAVGSSPKEFRKLVRDYKLKLDCPELTDEQRQPLPESLFTKVEEVSIMLLEATEEVTTLDYPSLHPNAKALLFSQVKKVIGMLGNTVQKYE